MWNFEQMTGKMIDPHGYVRGIGYSGAGVGKNQPQLQNVHNVGPIPQGTYLIGKPFDSSTHGPYALPLVPTPDTELFGRSAFLIHGDNVHAPGTASQGCVIMSRDVREAIWQSGDHDLIVTSGDPNQERTMTT